MLNRASFLDDSSEILETYGDCEASSVDEDIFLTSFVTRPELGPSERLISSGEVPNGLGLERHDRFPVAKESSLRVNARIRLLS
jgi:hypothetical protein